MSTLPHTLTTEELLDLVHKKESGGQKQPEDTSFLGFLSHYNILPGSHKVPRKIIAKLYQTWTRTTITPRSFQLLATNILPIEGDYFLLNQASLELAHKLNKVFQERSNKHLRPKLTKHFEDFLGARNIKKGRYWVEWFQIWYLYDQWCFDTKRKPKLNEESFKNFLALYFDLRWVGRDRVQNFSIHKSILKYLTEQQMQEIRTGRKQSNVHKQGRFKKEPKKYD